jgi:hypothetical protein
MGVHTSEADTPWWRLGDVVEWVQAVEPAAIVWQIRIELEGRCASGRIRAHGRRWLYRPDKPLWIDHRDVQFVLFADQYGWPQSSFEAMAAREWKDLTFFARPTPKMDRQYDVALEQALAQLVSPVELRSLSKHRLAWRDVEFWRADVIREWPQARLVRPQNEDEHEPRSDPELARAGRPISKLLTSRPAPLSDHDLRSWYEARVAELIKRGETSSSEDDWQMAQRQFPDRVKRARVRAAREELHLRSGRNRADAHPRRRTRIPPEIGRRKMTAADLPILTAVVRGTTLVWLVQFNASVQATGVLGEKPFPH